MPKDKWHISIPAWDGLLFSIYWTPFYASAPSSPQIFSSSFLLSVFQTVHAHFILHFYDVKNCNFWYFYFSSLNYSFVFFCKLSLTTTNLYNRKKSLCIHEFQAAFLFLSFPKIPCTKRSSPAMWDTHSKQANHSYLPLNTDNIKFTTL